jgi:hypothetical protein
MKCSTTESCKHDIVNAYCVSPKSGDKTPRWGEADFHPVESSPIFLISTFRRNKVDESFHKQFRAGLQFLLVIFLFAV